MKYQDVYLSTLIDYDEHSEAINSIEMDHRNSTGNWSGCGATELKKGALKKIESIYARIDRLWPAIEGGC